MSSAYESTTSTDCYILVWHVVVVLIWAFFFYLLLYVSPALTFRSQHFEFNFEIHQKCKTYMFVISHCIQLLVNMTDCKNNPYLFTYLLHGAETFLRS